MAMAFRKPMVASNVDRITKVIEDELRCMVLLGSKA